MKALNLDGALRACFRRFIVHRASPLLASVIVTVLTREKNLPLLFRH